jgi:hypothetical protein
MRMREVFTVPHIFCKDSAQILQTPQGLCVESEWIGVFSEWLFYPLKNHLESVQSLYRLCTNLLGLLDFAWTSLSIF